MLYLLTRRASTTLGLLLAIQFAAIAQAESRGTEPAAASLAAEPVAKVRPATKVKPQFKVRYGNDGSDVQGRGLGQLETFVPLGQTPGKSVTFGEAKLNLDEHLGGNLRLGYRQHLPGANRIWGGYLGYDYRSTGSANFGQLGLGFETLGDVWDLRLNGYLPVGSTRQQVGRSATPWVMTGTGGLVNTGNVAFQGNALQEIWQQNDRSDRSVTTVHQAALGGVELEGGAKLLRFDNGGDLRAYAGVYSLAGSHADSTIGWKLRLAAKPASGLTMGLGVQSDGLFGTNVLFNIGYGWPNALPKGKRDPVADVLARLGDGIERRDRIAVDRQVDQFTETQTTTSEQFITLINPATGQPWFFNHVVAGGSGVGTGTAENPFNGTTIQALLDSTPQDGNGVVYVAKGTGPIAGFNVPGALRVLSQGPTQLLSAIGQDGLTRTVSLPGSGQGVGANPLVRGGETVVNIASSPDFLTVLSGFDIQSANNAASTDTLGINIDDTQGVVQILNNRISDVDFGIEQASSSTEASLLEIRNNDVDADDSGIGILADGEVGLNGAVVIDGNRINAPVEGISLVAAAGGSLNGPIEITNNDISVEEIGILASALVGGNFNSNLAIDNNRIELRQSEAETIVGILFEVSPDIENSNPTVGSEQITITNNTITARAGGDAGVAVILHGEISRFETFPEIDTNFTVSNNTLSLPFEASRVNQADGIVLDLHLMEFMGNVSIRGNSGLVGDDGVNYSFSLSSYFDGTLSIQDNNITPGSDLAENHRVESCDESLFSWGTVESDDPIVEVCLPPP